MNELKKKLRQLARTWRRTAKTDRKSMKWAKKRRLDIREFYHGCAQAAELCAKQLEEAIRE